MGALATTSLQDYKQKHKRRPETKTGNVMVMMHTLNALMLITNLVYQTNYNLEII